MKALLYIAGGALLGGTVGAVGFLIAVAINPILGIVFVGFVCYKAFSY